MRSENMSYLQESGDANSGYFNGQRGNSSADSVLGTVDLFSASVKLPFVFGTLEGRDHLSVTLQANYIQQEPEEFFRQNRKSPQSVLGYGWSMELPAVVTFGSNVRQSYQRNFFLVGNGGTFPLYRIGKTENKVEFFAVEHPLWKFYFCEEEESYWEVHREDGSVWKYGGSKDSNALSLCWDNWIGPSVSQGAAEFASGWYLSEIRGAMGAAVEYQYENVQEPLGGGSYTRTMRLSRVVSSYGQQAQFSYLPKEDSEYSLMHPAWKGQNPWQEKYEDRYLESITFSNEKGECLYQQKLSYELRDSLEGEKKRLLASAVQVTAEGEALEPMTFSYGETEGTFGLLKEIHYPLAGCVRYGYETKTLPKSRGFGSVSLLEGWEAHVYTGDEFYLCLFRQENRMKGSIHYWDMGWQEFSLDFLENVRAEDVKAELGMGYACLSYRDVYTNRYILKVIKRCPLRRFHWETQEWVMENSGVRPALACGSDFIGFMEKSGNCLTILQYQYTDNCWHENILSVEGREFQALGAGNGFLLGAFGKEGNQSVRFLSFYSDEEHNWQVGQALDMSVNVDWSVVQNGSVWAIGSCHAGACFAALEGNMLQTTLALLSWTDDYKLNRCEIHNHSYPADLEMPALYAIATDTLIGYGEHVYRYEPEGWVAGKLLTPKSGGQYRYSYGSDVALGAEKTEGEHRFYGINYNPYSRQWEREGAPYCSNVSQYEGVCQPLAVGEYAVLGRNIFTFSQGGWEQIGNLEEGADYENVQTDASGSYLLYQQKAYRRLVQVPLLDNHMGEHETYEELCLDSGRALGFQSSDFGFYGFMDAGRELQMFRVRAHGYRSLQEAVLVSEIGSDYGMGTDSVFLDYDLDSARYEGGSPAFAKASVSLAEPDGSWGKIEYCYYHGASPERFPYPEDEWTNAADCYSHLKGQIRQAIEYDGSGRKVSANQNWYRAMDAMGFVLCRTRMQEQKFLPCRDVLSGAAAEESCIQETNIYTEYEDRFYQKRRMLKEAMDGKGEKKGVSTEFIYAWEKIPEMLAARRLTEMHQSLQKEEDTGKILSWQRYQYACTSNGRYYLQREEAYDDTWEEPWVCQREAVQVNEWGETVCEKDAQGQFHSYFYDASGNFLVAEFSNAAPNQALYCGFEDYENMDRHSMKKGGLRERVRAGTGFGGNRYLEIEKGNALIMKVMPGKEGLLAAFGAKSAGSIYLSFQGKVQKVSLKTEGWEKIFGTYLQESEEEIRVELYGEEDLLVTGVFLSPLLSEGKAYVYTGSFRRQTAVYTNRGLGSRVWYDRLENEIVSYQEDGTCSKLVRICRRQQENADKLDSYGIRPEPLPEKDKGFGFMPDETATIVMPKGGYVQRRGEERGDSSKWWRRQGMEWVFAPAENQALFFADSRKAADFQLTLGSLSLKKEKTAWQLFAGNNKKLAEGEISSPDYFLLLRVSDRLQLSWGGRILYTGAVSGLKGALEAQLSWKGEQEPEILGFGPDPQITVTFTDYAGKPIQDIGVTEHGIVVGATVYNALGQGEIVPRNVYLEGECWEYRSGFVENFDWSAGTLSGEQAKIYPEDGGYSYSQAQCTREPGPKPSCVGQAGKKWNISAGGKVTRYEYFSNLTSLWGVPKMACCLKQQISPAGNRLLEGTDGFGNTILSIAGGETSGFAVTKSEYDLAGNRVRVYYPNYFAGSGSAESFSSTYAYDGRNRMISQKESDSREVRFIYDKTGKIRFKYTGEHEGEYLYYVYDSYGRKTQEGWAKGAWEEEKLKKEANVPHTPPAESRARFQYIYDGDGSDAALLGHLWRTQSFDEEGRLVSEEEYFYDSKGRVSRQRICTKGHVEEMEIQWEERGNAVSYTIGNETIAYQYDLLGRLQEIACQGTCIYSCVYNSEGNVTKEIYAPDCEDKLVREYSYDSAQWLTAIRDKYFSQELSYNDDGKITRIAGGMAGDSQVWDYAYDSLGRLNSYAKGGEKKQIGLDINGNQILSDGEKYTYHSGTNRFAQGEGQTFVYGSSGNVARMQRFGDAWEYSASGSQSFPYSRTQPSQIVLEYDRVTGRIASVRQGEHTCSYDYGVSGCTAIHNGENTIWLTQDAQGRLLSETRQDGSRVWCVYGAKGAAAMILDGSVYYLIKDYHGSVCGVYQEGKMLAEFSYDPKGRILDRIIRDETVNRLIPLRFIGARYEEDYGLYRMKYRLYDPVIGRFLNIDPENQYASPYIYGGADWVNYIDPEGAASAGWSVLSFFAGIACILGGAALMIATAGMGSAAGIALGFVGAGVIGAGIGVTTYSISAVISDDFKLTDCLIYAGMGFLSGAAGAGIGAGVSALTPVIGMTASALVDVGTGIVVGGADAFLSNGLINLNHHRDFCKNWGVNVAIGCVVGGIGGCISGMSSALRNQRAFFGRTQDYTLGIKNYSLVGAHGHLRLRYNEPGMPDMYTDYGFYGVRNAEYQSPGGSSHMFQVNERAMNRFNRDLLGVEGKYNRYFKTTPDGTREFIVNQNIVGPNCTTYVMERLASGGINMPIWMRSPALASLWNGMIRRFQ